MQTLPSLFNIQKCRQLLLTNSLSAVYLNTETHSYTHTGFSLRIEVAGGYYKITGESGDSEQNLTSSFYRLMKFSWKNSM